MIEGGDDAVNGFAGEVFHGLDFCAGEAGFAEVGLAKFQHLFGRRCAAVTAEGFDTAKDGGGGFAGDGLVGDRFEECFVGGLERIRVGLEGNCIRDKLSKTFVAGGEMLHGLLEIERRDADGLGSVFKHSYFEESSSAREKWKCWSTARDKSGSRPPTEAGVNLPRTEKLQAKSFRSKASGLKA